MSKKDLIPFQKGFDPRRNKNGAPRKLISTFSDIGYTKREINDCIQNILALTLEEIKQVMDNEECTILERTIAKALVKGFEKGSLWNLESTLSRSFGTPTNNESQTTDNKIEIIYVEGKTIL